MFFKKVLYVSLFSLLGVMLVRLCDGIVEWVLYRAGYSTIQATSETVLFILSLGGLAFGYWCGIYFWRVIYIEKRRRHWFSRKAS